MTRFRFASLVFLASLAVAGCDKKQVVNVHGPSPNPSPPQPPVVSGLFLSLTQAEISLNTCPGFVEVTGEVQGTNVNKDAIIWSSSGGGTLTRAGNRARLTVSVPGDYTITGTAEQNQSVSRTIPVKAVGNGCAGPNPPPPGPGPGPGPTPDRFSLSFEPHGDSKPVGTRQELTATCKKNDVVAEACAPVWISSVTDRIRIIGPNVGQKVTIEYVSPHTAEVTATWEGAFDKAPFTGTGGGPGPGPTPAPQCRNGKDDDGDGKIDHPADPGCTNPDDDDERDPSPPPPPVISVNVQPKTFTCSVGGQANVGVVVNGTTDQRVTWTISDTSVVSQKEVNQGTIVMNCLKAGTVTVRATAFADPSKSDFATGTVTATPTTCTWTTSTGLQGDGSVRVSRNQTISATATCTGPGGSMLPAWYSSEPSRVGVKGDAVTVINGESFQTGNNGTITGVFTGQASVCVQAAIDKTSPSFCRTVVVQ
jgi:hypothetical protein